MASTTTDPGAAESLLDALVAELLAAGAITSPEVEAAFRRVPRHVFAPEVPLEEAYANSIVRTKRDEHGVTTSSVSAPWLQAAMLEQAEIAPGARCLEIGSGGYNAALMAELAGPDGEVTTVDIDADVIERAARFLPEAGYGRVNIIHADAEDGVVEHAPYDRTIVTVGMWDVPPAWIDQLAVDGRLVVPLRMRGLSRSLALVRDGDHLVSVGHEMAGFVTVQGAGAHTERLITLHGEDVGLRFDDDPHLVDEVDVEAMRAALLQPRAQVWSGVRFGGMEPFDGLFLCLATIVDRFCLLSRARTDTARELVDPASPIATPTLLGDDGFAYVAFRPVDQEEQVFEFGAYAHGPAADELARALVEHVIDWDRGRRNGPPAVISIHPVSVIESDLPAGRRIRKRHSTVTISWPDR